MPASAEKQIRQQLSQHLLRVGILLADEAAHTDVTPPARKGPGEALFHQSEFKARGAIAESALTSSRTDMVVAIWVVWAPGRAVGAKGANHLRLPLPAPANGIRRLP